MLGKTEGQRRRGRQRLRWLDGITDSEFEQTPGDGEGCRSLEYWSMGWQRIGHHLATIQQQYVNPNLLIYPTPPQPCPGCEH